MNSSFAHLHVHSQYSLLEAVCDLKKLALKAHALGMSSLALTDNGNMFGSIEFYLSCKDVGVNPIIGLDAYIAPLGRFVKGQGKESGSPGSRRLVLLAQNMEGYRNLSYLSSLGYQEGFYYKPRIDYELLKKYSAGLIALSGGLRGDVPLTFFELGPEKALEKIRDLSQIFPESFYLELLRTGIPDQEKLNNFLIEASKITGVPLVAANDVHYLEKDDSIAQEILVCIGTNRTLQDESRHKLGSEEFYFKSSDQMRSLFFDAPEACDNTLEIAKRCELKFKFKDESGKPIYHLPTYPTQDGRSLAEEMKTLSHQGLHLRFEEAAARGEAVPESQKQNYFSRLEFELKVIDEMGFNGYFLIVQDFIGWAKSQEIPVGPGRGSGAGSLVAYSLRITDLDPVVYGLIFERFLNPERVSMPDFDVDFCQDRRQEVIDYVTKKYTNACVSQIITFGKLQCKAALRDVGRVLGMTFSEVDVIAKLIPEKLGITIEQALESEARLQQLREDNPKISNLIGLALKVEGINRHAGIHAAGVIISDRPLVEHAPLYKSEDGANVLQLDMKHSEKVGLIKFDFLGLKTLTLIHDALKLIERNRGRKISTSEISLKDPGIYELMSRGDTAGVFQFEGDGISDLIRKAKPSCFEDITAINALYRPGPMQMLDEYIGRKQGKISVSYLFPQLQEILNETYGVILYQEQVQLIAARIANYSLGEADMLRRAMGKKIAKEMDQQRSRFMQGATSNGFAADKAEELFDLMAKFAEYGFNKSHSAAYCVVAAQTAWLKAYYPVEFYAAMLSTEMGDTDKVVWYVQDARQKGLVVKAPHVNFSEFKFSVKGEQIFFGLGAIKGVGQAAVEALLEAKSTRPDGFKDLEDFFNSIDLRRINKKVIECLIKAGALDGFGATRAEMMAGYSMFMESAEIHRRETEVGQTNLFTMPSAVDLNFGHRIELPKVKPWKKLAQLEFEKEVLGFYLSDHPLSGMEGVFKPFVQGSIRQLLEMEGLGKREVTVGGLLGTLREVITRKGTRMAFGQLEDLTGSIEFVVFPDCFAKYETLLRSGGPLLVKGRLEKEEESIQIIAESVELLDQRIRQSQRVYVSVDSDLEPKLDRLREVFDKFPGGCPVFFRVPLVDLGKSVTLSAAPTKGISISREFLDEVQSVTGRSDFVELQN